MRVTVLAAPVIASVAVSMLGAGAVLTPHRAHGATLTTLYNFKGGSDGSNPTASLFYQSGALYGTTSGGGTLGFGTVFKVNSATGAETVLHSFAGSPDGEYSFAGLVPYGGTLFGTTSQGGTSGIGTVFQVQTATGAEKVIYSFADSLLGYSPVAGLNYYAGMLYGTTEQGGNLDLGTVFVVNPATGSETVLYEFKGGTDGASPLARLIVAPYLQRTVFYGTTQGGSLSQYGTVFIYFPKTATEKVLYSFKGGADGAAPDAGLIYQSGLLFGTTAGGGASGFGTVFAINPNTASESVLYSFKGGTDGRAPMAGLIYYGGMLYGTTYLGGTGCAPSGCGTVFQVNPATGAETVLYRFTGGSDGEYPLAGLISQSGILYGTTSAAGSDAGTVFKITP